MTERAGILDDVPLSYMKKLIKEGNSKNRIAMMYKIHQSTVDAYLRKQGTTFLDLQIEIMKEAKA